MRFELPFRLHFAFPAKQVKLHSDYGNKPFAQPLIRIPKYEAGGFFISSLAIPTTPSSWPNGPVRRGEGGCLSAMS